MVKYLLIFGFIFLIGCSDTQEAKRPLKSSYVQPSINYKGQFRKGYVRKSVSTNPKAIRNQSKSRYYYKNDNIYNHCYFSAQRYFLNYLITSFNLSFTYHRIPLVSFSKIYCNSLSCLEPNLQFALHEPNHPA
jgi:hypothetical protein